MSAVKKPRSRAAPNNKMGVGVGVGKSKRNEDLALKKALEDAVDFAATYRKGKDMTRDLSDIKQEEKIVRLQNDLKKSKQQVVRHLIKCRSIESTIKQSNMTNDAIKNHVSVQPVEFKSRNQNSAGNSMTTSFKKNGLSSAYLVEQDLKAIESIPSLIDPTNLSPLPSESAFSLQRSLNSYDDDFLTNELENFPTCQIDAINVMLFAKIAWISSGKHISISEAIDIYQIGDRMSATQLEHLHLRGRITSHTDRVSDDRNLIRWIILKNMLRKKLRLQYLAVQLSKYDDIKRTGKQRTTAKTAEMTGRGTKRTQKSQKLLSKSLDFNSKFSLPDLNVLSTQLEKSQDRQLSLSSKINSNISMVSRSVPLGSLQAASNYSKKVGGKKMYNILYIKAKGFYRIAFDKMKNNMKMYKYELVCQHFLKSYASHRFYYASCSAVQNKTRRRLHDWKTKLNNLRTLEQFAAIVEIQRMIRGKSARIYFKNIHKHRAATVIQKNIRAFMAKALIKKLLEHKRLKEAVSFIEKCWKNQTWQRALKNLFKLRKQTLASELIIRVYHGHKGRTIARAKRLVVAKQVGALKMQCLWRRYQATVIVDIYYSQRRRVEAAIMIQKVTRGIQGRRHVAAFKRDKLAAECIQRGARCRQAKKERKRRHLNKHSTHVQRIMRGKLARDRVSQMRKRRAQEMAEYAAAFNVLEKMILGHARRKKYIPLIEINRKKRLAAATAIKLRYKAVKEGNRDRALLTLKRHSVGVIVSAIQQYMYYKYLRIECATLIQSVMRRYLAKRILKLKYEEYMLKMSRRSLYYRLKNMYQKDQEAFFGNHATVIQTYWREHYAYKMRTEMKLLLERTHAAEEIQRVGMNYVRRREAKEITNEKRKLKYKKEYAAIKIQKIGRGKRCRNEYFKHRQVNIIRWFLVEAKVISKTKGLFLNFKKRKKHLILLNAAAVKIQAIARGMTGRGKVRNNYKRLVRNRDKTVKRRRERAAMKIQSIVRRRQAMKIVRLRQAEFAEKERKRKQLEELDNKLDDLHETHLNDLLALRVQQGVRGSQARKHRQMQEEKIIRERKNAEEEKRRKAVAILQGLARGIKGRRKFQEMLPDLRKQLRARSFCVECELAPATRKCRVCREQFCDVCFQNLHKKGTRKGHGFDYLRKGDDELEETDNLGENNPLMWEEQWDESAQARYWYHSLTGEATWINPFE